MGKGAGVVRVALGELLGWGAFLNELVRSVCISGAPSSWGAVLGLEPRLGPPGTAPLTVAKGNQCIHKHLQRSPFPLHRSLDTAPLPAWTREIPAKPSLVICVLQANPCGWVSESCPLPWHRAWSSCLQEE